MAMMDKVIIWRRPDGTFETQYIIKESKPNDLSDDEYIDQLINRALSNPNYANKQVFIKPKSELKNSVLSVSDKNRRRLKINSSGQFSEDRQFQTADELMALKKSTIKGKLVSGIPLSENEADFMLRAIR